MSFPVLSSAIRTTEAIFASVTTIADLTVNGLNSLAEEAREDKKIKQFRKESETAAKLLRIEADSKADMLSAFKSLKKSLSDSDYDDCVKAGDEILQRFESFRVKN